MTNPTEAEKLLPCPFCGGTEPDVELRVSITDAGVACSICGSRTGLVQLGHDERDAAYRKREVIAAWNTRTPAPRRKGAER